MMRTANRTKLDPDDEAYIRENCHICGIVELSKFLHLQPRSITRFMKDNDLKGRFASRGHPLLDSKQPKPDKATRAGLFSWKMYPGEDGILMFRKGK